MKVKQIIRICTDVAMTVLFLLVMAYHITGNGVHEWLGISLFVLFLLHHALNIRWYTSLFKGKWTVIRAFQTILNLLLTVDMLLIMLSGIMLSREVFGFLHIIKGTMLARRMHMVTTAWGYLLMAMHLGYHWGMVIGMSRKMLAKIVKRPIKASRTGQVISGIIAAGLSAYGVYAFIRRSLWERMFLLVEYAFFDFYEPPVFFFMDYVAILILFAAIAYYLIKCMLLISKYGKRKRTVHLPSEVKGKS
ncbi:MAG: DUF4405 domain-containing protein [Ruminococcus flavefaciens]|nr:DUF4405 domain-containing protein [Ruminococcus flavefaciens]